MEKKAGSESELVQEAAETNTQAGAAPVATSSSTDIAISHQLHNQWTDLYSGASACGTRFTWSASSTSRELHPSARGFSLQLPPPPRALTREEPPSALAELLDQNDPAPSVRLTDAELWASFARIGNEMIVTKYGRRFFPQLMIAVSGLLRTREYNITLHLVSADDNRYRYIGGKWQATTVSEILHEEDRMKFLHPNSPATGEIWMKKPVSFKTVKITHDPHNKKQAILLVHTMHKYVAKIDIVAANSPEDSVSFTLDDTAFIAVTSYQSSELTDMKINHNPFAKGLRDKERMTSTFSPYLSVSEAAAPNYLSPLAMPSGVTPHSPPLHVLPYVCWPQTVQSPGMIPSVPTGDDSVELAHANEVDATSPSNSQSTS